VRPAKNHKMKMAVVILAWVCGNNASFCPVISRITIKAHSGKSLWTHFFKDPWSEEKFLVLKVFPEDLVWINRLERKDKNGRREPFWLWSAIAPLFHFGCIPFLWSQQPQSPVHCQYICPLSRCGKVNRRLALKDGMPSGTVSWGQNY
jgi:hypothetical protein